MLELFLIWSIFVAAATVFVMIPVLLIGGIEASND
jgi:hypothetical protein